MANSHSIDLEKSSSQYLYASDSASLSITGDLTIEAWIKPESSTSEMAIVGKDSGASQNSYRLHLLSDGTIDFLISQNGTYNAGQYGEKIFGCNISDGVWTHIALVYTASTHTAELFINGTSFGTGDVIRTSIFNSTTVFSIGANQGNANSFDGLIDEVRIWNVARTGTQINDNKSVSLVGNETGLQGYWSLNNSLLDITANDNDLTAVNSPVFSTDIPFTESVSVTVNQGTPPVATFSIPAYTVTAIQNVSISQGTPPVATFSIPAYEAQISVSVSPDAQILTFSIPAYDILIADVSVSPTTQVLTFSIPAPTVSAEQFVTVSPDPVSLTISIPSYELISSVSVDVETQVLTFSLPSPDVSGGATISPAVSTLTFSIPSYTTTGVRNVEVSASVLALTFSTPAPSITTTRFVIIDMSPIILTLTIPAYTIVADFWQEKYASPNTSWSDKHSTPAVSWSDKY